MDRHNHHLKTRHQEPAEAAAPSNSSSPNHEFSFTISLHSVPPDARNRPSTPHNNNNPSSIAIDLSPADDIFFHGHLLPLHLLSHLPPVSPRSSTNSIETFPLPIITDVPATNSQEQSFFHAQTEQSRNRGSSAKTAKSFSQMFGLAKWRKGILEANKEQDQEANKQKSKVSHLIKRYVRMVRPLMFFRNRKRSSENVPFRSQPPYSFSGNLSDLRSSGNDCKQEMMMRRGRRREFFSSAPASMRTSPNNSGLLVATATLPSSASSDSTMEELQAAIQAAIAHCKNSIAVEEKLKCQD